MLIVDSHCHAGAGDGLTGPWDTRASLDRYLRRAERLGIGRTVLIPVFHSDYRAANREIGRIVARDPARFSGYAMVHPARDAGRVLAMVREAVEGYGACGIKVHRHDARITREVCEAAQALRRPILYDVMGDVAPVELLATEYPVPFVIPHLGSFMDDWRAHLALIDLLVRHPNVYADTSGVRRFDFLAEAVRRAGARKILFGSDGPWLHPGLELAKVRALGLVGDDLRLVLGGNWTRLVSRRRQDRPPVRDAAWQPHAARAAVRTPIPERADPWAGSQFPA